MAQTTHRSWRSFRWALVPLGVVLLTGCQNRPGRTSASVAQAVVDIKREADAWDQAIVRKDRPAIAANMTDDFRIIRSSGELGNKASFMEDITSPELTIHPYTVEDLDIRVYGDSALVCGRTRMTGVSHGRPFALHYRYVDTYLRSEGRWKVGHVQITEMQPSGTT